MKKVRYVGKMVWWPYITCGKVYDVISYDYPTGLIVIADDIGDERPYYTVLNDEVWFEDVTAEYRDNILDELLSE